MGVRVNEGFREKEGVRELKEWEIARR